MMTFAAGWIWSGYAFVVGDSVAEISASASSPPRSTSFDEREHSDGTTTIAERSLKVAELHEGVVAVGAHDGIRQTQTAALSACEGPVGQKRPEPGLPFRS
jgi:hypothetical protein